MIKLSSDDISETCNLSRWLLYWFTSIYNSCTKHRDILWSNYLLTYQKRVICHGELYILQNITSTLWLDIPTSFQHVRASNPSWSIVFLSCFLQLTYIRFSVIIYFYCNYRHTLRVEISNDWITWFSIMFLYNFYYDVFDYVKLLLCRFTILYL